MTLRGSTKEFDLNTVLRLLGDTKKTGELALRGEKGEGALGLAEGRVITAVFREEKPIPALGHIFGLGEVEFEFTPWNDAPTANLEGDLDSNLKKADEYAKWLADVRTVIPHDAIRFRLSERAADQGAVTFTSDRWRVVMAVNARPSVTELATNLHIDRDDALTTLTGLVRDGVIETIDEPAPQSPAPAPGPPIAAEMSAPSFAPEPPAEVEPQPEAAPAAEFPAEDWTAELVRKKAEAEVPEEPAPPPAASAPQSAPAWPEVPGAATWKSETSAPIADSTPVTDAWSQVSAPPLQAPESGGPAPVPDWTGSPAAPGQAWTPPAEAPAPQDWNAVPAPMPAPDEAAAMPPPPDWTTSPAASEEWTAPTPQWTPQAPAAPPDWTSAPAPTNPAPFTPEPVPAPPPDAFTPTSERFASAPDAYASAEPAAEATTSANDWMPAQPAEPAPMDDRLAALQGMFNTPAPAQPTSEWKTPAADTWTVPTQPAPAQPAEDPRLAAMSAPAPAEPKAPPAATPSEWAPPPSIGAPAPKKSGGLFGGLFGGKKSASAEPQRQAQDNNGGAAAASRAGKLAAFSNALLSEYTSGTYGKGKVDERMPSLLMRVDEQADPIDRPLPIVDDRLDVQALERVQIAENQTVPYLAMLVSTIYGDAEKAFGRDKAKRGYKNAQQQIFGGDTSALSGPDVAGKLPKV